ncbi:hypothetical protein [Streptomyces sp. S.PB5]|uniref:hypothetical protein n=1 Tax=Streptomyces sp. S.PB5 TaxID=3020844 RepID=UPI0025B13696|nr:hypothetical protein [Streptomyces sp. S.PB5]MDN3023027.1 hypothetical protein [Streptomyces sp. S.PB5]
MRTVTLPPEQRHLPRPGRYAVAPGRSLVELAARYGPLPTYRRRLDLTAASLTVPDDGVDEGLDTTPDTPLGARPAFRFELSEPPAVVTATHVEPLDGGRHLQGSGDLELRGVAFPVLLRLRVVERTDDLLLVVGTARMSYRLLRRATGFRLPWRRPATRVRLLIAAEFTPEFTPAGELG